MFKSTVRQRGRTPAVTAWRAAVLCTLAVTTILVSTAPAHAATASETPPARFGYFPLNPVTKLDESVPSATSVTLDGSANYKRCTGTCTAATTVYPIGPVNLPVTGFTALEFQVTVTSPTATSTLKTWAADASEPTYQSVPYNVGETTTQDITVATSNPGSATANNEIVLKNIGPAAQVKAVLIGGWAKEYCDAFRGCLSYDMGTPDSSTVPLSPVGPYTTLGGDGTLSVTLDGTQVGVPTTASQLVFRIAVRDNGANTGTHVSLEEPAATSASWSNSFDVLAYTNPSGVGQNVFTVRATNGAVRIKLSQASLNGSLVPFGSVDLTAAVSGWIDSGRVYHSVTTRNTKLLTSQSISSGGTVNVDTAGVAGLPGPGDVPYERASHAFVVLRAFNPTANGTVSVNGVTQLTVVNGKPTTNTVLAPIDATGKVSLTFNATGGSGTVSLDAEIAGWINMSNYQSAYNTHFTPVAPFLAWISWCCSGDAAGITQTAVVTGTNGVPAKGVSHVLVHVEGYDINAPTSVRTWGPNTSKPMIPQVEIGAGRDDAADVMAEVSSDGRIGLEVGSSAVIMRATVLGYYSPYNGDTSLSTTTASTAVIGDSVTYLSRIQTYATNQSDDPSRHLLLNQRGTPGNLTHQLRWRAHELANSHPANVILELGSNDFGAIWQSGNYYSSNNAVIEEMNRMVTDDFPTACVYAVNWVVGYPGMGPYADGTKSLNSLRADTSAPGGPRGLGTIDFAQLSLDMTPSGGTSPLIGPDGLHPTVQGQQALAYLYDQAITGGTNGAMTKANGQPVVWSTYIQTCTAS